MRQALRLQGVSVIPAGGLEPLSLFSLEQRRTVWAECHLSPRHKPPPFAEKRNAQPAPCGSSPGGAAVCLKAAGRPFSPCFGAMPPEAPGRNRHR